MTPHLQVTIHDATPMKVVKPTDDLCCVETSAVFIEFPSFSKVVVQLTAIEVICKHMK